MRGQEKTGVPVCKGGGRGLKDGSSHFRSCKPIMKGLKKMPKKKNGKTQEVIVERL